MILLRRNDMQEGGDPKLLRPSIGKKGFWRRVLEPFRRRAPRCRGCGCKRGPTEEPTSRHGENPFRARETLCTNCRTFVEQMSQDARVMAVFIFGLGKGAKYYAGFQVSTS